MNIKFVSLTKDNFEKFKHLKVSKNQIQNIETIKECFEEARNYNLWNPFVIIIDGLAVGFTMYGKWLGEDGIGRIWFDRFFIDEKFQKRGYSKPAIFEILKKIEKEYECKELYLSVYIDNHLAIEIYKYFGFEFNGDIDTKGEYVMVKKFNIL